MSTIEKKFQNTAEILYLTTPAFYINSNPHIGHAYTAIVVDVVNRFAKVRGVKSYFVTGTDEHGEKVQKAALANGSGPQKYADQMAESWARIWKSLNIDYDDFIRTTEQRHIDVVVEMLQAAYNKGDILFGEYDGLYCVGCERFLTETDLVNGKCVQHGTFPESRTEENYFFNMESYRKWMREYIMNNKSFIRPISYRNHVLKILDKPIGHLSISRPVSRVGWGIPLPWDNEHVTYVWFDALINYISALESQDLYDVYWPHAQHFIGKDILKPHTLFWMSMLKSAQLPMYKHLNVHGYWLTENTKMSKSKGNTLDPIELSEKYGTDCFRYYLLRDMTFGLDSSFTESAFVKRINSDLVNDLGNLLSRVVSMIIKYLDGMVPPLHRYSEREQQLKEKFLTVHSAAIKHFDALEFDRAVEKTMTAVRETNRYIADVKPWELARDPENEDYLCSVLNTCVEALFYSSLLLDAVMPSKMQNLRRCIGQGDQKIELSENTWGSIIVGRKVNIDQPLFPRIQEM